MAEDVGDNGVGVGEMDVMEVEAGLQEVGRRLSHLLEPELLLLQKEPDLLPTRATEYELVDVNKLPDDVATAIKVWWGKRIEMSQWGQVDVWSEHEFANVHSRLNLDIFFRPRIDDITCLKVGANSVLLRLSNGRLRLRDEGSLGWLFADLLRQFSDESESDIRKSEGAYLLREAMILRERDLRLLLFGIRV